MFCASLLIFGLHSCIGGHYNNIFIFFTAILNSCSSSVDSNDSIDIELQCDMLFMLATLCEGDLHRKVHFHFLLINKSRMEEVELQQTDLFMARFPLCFCRHYWCKLPYVRITSIPDSGDDWVRNRKILGPFQS